MSIKDEPHIVQVSTCGSVDPKQIPKTVGMLLAETLLPALQEAYADPDIQADYHRWKAENAERLAEEYRSYSSQKKEKTTSSK